MINTDILKGLAVSRLKVRYRGSITGILWVLFQPLTLYAVQLAVFQKVLPVDHINYPFFLASGFFPWFFFQQSILMGTGTFLANARLVQSLTIHPTHYVVAVLLDTLLSFLLSFSISLFALCLYFNQIQIAIFAKLIIALIPLLIGTFFIVWMCAMFQVFLRDTAFIMQFGLHVLFIITPIFYSFEMLPPHYQRWLQFNPLFIFLHPFRLAFSESAIAAFIQSLLNSTVFAFLISIPTIFLWKKTRYALIARL